jgi:hypothetical protein
MKINNSALAVLTAVFSTGHASRPKIKNVRTGNISKLGLSDLAKNVVTDVQDQEASCDNPTMVGNIRGMLDPSRCVDPEGSDGDDVNVNTDLCDNFADQIFKFCEDGTIRSSMRGHCLHVESTENVVITPCQVYPTIQEDQQWELVRETSETIMNGVTQDVFRIVNVASGSCLNIVGSTGRGNIEVYTCLDDREDQKFFIYNRGNVIGEGKLMVKDTGMCLSAESGGIGELVVADCVDEDYQAFTFYESGELVNDLSGHCIDINDLSGSGNIRMFACDNRDDQRWMKILEDEDYFSLTSFATVSSDAYGETTHCMHVESSNVESHECNDVDYQKWTWTAKEWTTPNTWWGQVICNESGGVTTSISTSIETTNTASSAMTTSITNSWSIGLVGASTTYSSAITSSFERASTDKVTVDVSCETSSGTSCLWQWNMETESVSLGSVKWESNFIKCTDSNIAPVCGPFEECVDDDCTACEYVSQSTLV